MGMWRRVGMILVVWLSGFGRMFAGAGGALSQPSADASTLDSSEQVYISSLALLKMLKHARLRNCDTAAVPPNASLQITLELVSWKTISYVGDDKKIIKKILTEWEGYEKLNEGAIVKVYPMCNE
ncbi:hypothetical protein POM88_007801 [Heracleum sosnowskyi]|uniref:Uncharacterized protein n=1 Tax=Heracleum sosnowskyi TaxID=360622 RepID=A0AAD8N7Y4_9APIA|nr:hypothetical protein POM88_007801 [Heracleum sosnowskyi]